MGSESVGLEISDTSLSELVRYKIIEFDEDDNLIIKFLLDQRQKVSVKSVTSRDNGKMGGRPPKNLGAGSNRIYVVRLYDESEEFYKLGITSTSVQRRMSNIPYKYDIILEHQMGCTEALKLESDASSMCENYQPLKKFGGHMECFKDETELMMCVNRLLAKPNNNLNESEPKAEKSRVDKSREEQIRLEEKRESNVGVPPTPDTEIETSISFIEPQKNGNTARENFTAFIPPEVGDVINCFASTMTALGLPHDAYGGAEKLGTAFVAYYSTQGWRKGNGIPLTAWRPLIPSWLADEKGKASKSRPPTQQPTERPERSWNKKQ